MTYETFTKLEWTINLILSIYMRSHYRNVKVMTKAYKPCLSFFISFSFSRLSCSLHRLSLSSLTSLSSRLSSTLSLYMRLMKQSYFIVLTVCTHDIRNHERLEWLLNHILSFSQSVHVTYKTMTDYHQCGAHSGSPQ